MQKRLFSELGLSEPILKAVEKLGFEQTSPIQSAAIPVLMSGKDVVGQSATGSGKTAAFAIPAIERVADTDRKVQIIVLTPTRELATQVAEEFARLSLFRPKVHAVPIYGGASYDRQFSELRKGPQIVIGTPGRVIDHLQRNTLDLSEVKLAVLDECDRMLDMGFREDMERILSATPEGRQTVFFSATLPPPIKRLIEQFSHSPEHIKIEGQAMTVPTVEQVYFDVPPRAKLDALTRLIDVHDARLSLVFANTQRTVDDLADALIARGYAADRLHGGISQMLRTRTMAKFKKSEFDILVATDVAGRGIDVDNLDLVINFDLPYDPEDYVHRVGRTGRAGRKGVALTLISGREVYRLQNVERFTRQRIRRGYVPTWDQVEEKRMSGVLDKVRAVLEAGKHTAHGIYIDRLMDEGHAATDLAAAMLHQLLESEGIEMLKPGSADPFARKDAAPLRPAPAKVEPKSAPAAKMPSAVLPEPAVEKTKPSPAPLRQSPDEVRPPEQKSQPVISQSEPQTKKAESGNAPSKRDLREIASSMTSDIPITGVPAGPAVAQKAPLVEEETQLSADAVQSGVQEAAATHQSGSDAGETTTDLPETIKPKPGKPGKKAVLPKAIPEESVPMTSPALKGKAAPRVRLNEDGDESEAEKAAPAMSETGKPAKKAVKAGVVPEEGIPMDPIAPKGRAAARFDAAVEEVEHEHEDRGAYGGGPRADKKARGAGEGAAQPKPQIPGLKSPGGPRQLPAPATGYKWITLSLGKNDGILPRDVVDAITQDGAFEGKAVGLIKIHDTESDVQVRAEQATAIVESLDGGNFEGKQVKVHFSRTAVSPWEKKGGKYGDKPGGFRGKPGGFGGKPGGFYKKPGGYGDGPRSAGPRPDSYRPDPDRPRPYGGSGGGAERGAAGPRPFARDERRTDGPRGNFRGREDSRSGPPQSGPPNRYGSPKKGPGRW